MKPANAAGVLINGHSGMAHPRGPGEETMIRLVEFAIFWAYWSMHGTRDRELNDVRSNLVCV